MGYSLEYLHYHGTDHFPHYSWKQFAMCGNKALLDKIRRWQRHPENWRIVPNPIGIEKMIKQRRTHYESNWYRPAS